MCATYRALCEHGYANLTIQRISDQFPKSKSLLYHHYDGKDELLVDFLAYVLDHFEAAVPLDSVDDPQAQLTELLDYILPTAPDHKQCQFIAAIIELRAQAVTGSEYQDQFTRSTQYFHDRFAEIIERGIADRQFNEVDSDRVASLLVTVIEGSMLQQATLEAAHSQELVAATRSELDAYIETRLLAVDSGSST